MTKLKLGILGSTRGTDLLALLQGIAKNTLHASIEVVVSNKENAGILERAKSHDLPALFVEPKNNSREAYDQKLSVIFKEYQVDLIVLIGYMKILSKEFITAWQQKIINVHPSLLPKYAGGMDKDVHQCVIDNKEIETGCTVHYVTEEVDEGPILIQKKCSVLPTDTADTLKNRVQQLEGEALIEAINTIGKTK